MRVLPVTFALSLLASAAQAQGLGPGGGGGGGGGGITGGVAAALPPVDGLPGVLLLMIALFAAWHLRRFGLLPVGAAIAGAAAGLPAWAVLSIVLASLAASVARVSRLTACAVPAVVFAMGLWVAHVEADALTPVMATVVGSLLGAFFSPVTTMASTVYGPSGFVAIVPACLALEGAVVGFALSSAISLMRGASARRALCAGSAHVALWITANVLRIVVVGVVVQRSVETAEIVHDFGGPFMMLVQILCVGVVLRLSPRHDKPVAPRGPTLLLRTRHLLFAVPLFVLGCDVPPVVEADAPAVAAGPKQVTSTEGGAANAWVTPVAVTTPAIAPGAPGAPGSVVVVAGFPVEPEDA